jgi:hypothetical protein
VSSYLDAAQRLLEALERDPLSALAGGVAVAAHGYLRATKDVDIVVGIPLREAQARLQAHGIASTLRCGDPLEGDFSCLKGVVDGVPFDVIPQLVNIAWERRETVSVGGATVEVVDLLSLFDLKLRAGSPRDLVDVAILALLHPGSQERALELARRRRLDGDLARFLADPRHRALAAELRADEAARAAEDDADDAAARA